jgi:hypothetical protein
METLRKLLRATPLRYAYHRLKAFTGGSAQSNEASILSKLAVDCPKTFVEFGFHPTEYNCIALRDFSGLLIDGDAATVRLAKKLLPSRVEVRNMFLTLDNLKGIARHFPEIGVLSIDVDGNDYWFLESLLLTRPYVVAVEYNASLGLESITVPYSPTFDRHSSHPSGWYHGASLTALTKLCSAHGMKLVAIATGGGNAFFVRNESPLVAIDPKQSYLEGVLRNKWSGTTASEQWATIKQLPYVTI